MTYTPSRCARCNRRDDLDEAGLCWVCVSDRDERENEVRSAHASDEAGGCPATCPPFLVRAGESCSLPAGHDGPHTIPIGDIDVGSSWIGDDPRVHGWLDELDERENEDRSHTSPDRAAGPTLPDSPVAGRAALVSGLGPDCDDATCGGSWVCPDCDGGRDDDDGLTCGTCLGTGDCPGCPACVDPDYDDDWGAP